MENKIYTKLKNNLDLDSKVENIIIKDQYNIEYLLGIGSEHMVLIFINKKPYLLVNEIEYLEVNKHVNESKIEIVILKNDLKEIRETLQQLTMRTFYIDINDWKVLGYETLKTFFKSKKIRSGFPRNKPLKIQRSDFSNLRLIKSESEIIKIKKAIKITEDIFEKIYKKISSIDTEENLNKFIKIEIAKSSCEQSFSPVVAAGVNGSNPHNKVTKYKFQKNEIITIDMGVKYEGYCSDLTRTFFLGTPSKRQKEIYNILLKVLDEVIKAIKHNVKVATLDKIARKIFKANNVEQYFIHALGHGFGLEIHEKPTISYLNENDVIKENMVISIEPGIYIPNEFGIRLERNILVKNNTSEILDKLSVKLKNIKK